MRKVEYYKTNIGLFVEVSGLCYSYNKENYKINGVLLSTLNEVAGYVLLEGQTEITSLERKKSGGSEFAYYELKNPDLASDKIPLEKHGVKQVYDEDEEGYVTDDEDFNKILSLYSPVYNQLEPSWVAEEFEVVCKREVEVSSFDKPEDMKIKIITEGSWGKGQVTDLSNVVTYYLLEQLMTPEFLLHKRPCYISSDNLYKIIRAYVKDNINPKEAVITSDYDFCFTVKKKVHIKPYEVTREIKKSNGKSYAKPQYKTNTVSTKEVEVFNMTSETKKYRDYTVLKPLTANSLEDLKDRLDEYLKDLMHTINTPVADCEHCKGTGHIIHRMQTNGFEEV